jgi:glycine/sarcosine N-methyltransferase
MTDLYTDLAADYQWLFSDHIVGETPSLGLTSPGAGGLIAAAVDALAPGAPVLDCACGIGSDALALARKGFKVTATDGSPSMVAAASERLTRLAAPVSVAQSLWEDLPARVDGRFDLAFCLGNAIVHAGSIPRMTQALRGIRSVLRPDGKIVVDSRNWELMYKDRPRIVSASSVKERDGIRCVSFYIWTIPEEFHLPCQAEIVFLFEDQDNAVTHRRYELTFQPFSYLDLRDSLESAGFEVVASSFEPTAPFYAVEGRAAVKLAGRAP